MAFSLATVAVVWMGLFVAWALSQRFVAEDDDSAFIRIVVVATLAVTAAVWVALHTACSRGLSWARTAGLLGGWLLVALALISSFGLVMLPAAVALVWAGALTPVSGASAHPRRR